VLINFVAVKVIGKLLVVVNRWSMTPADVNAFYNPPFNQIGIPAGILQRPIYDASFPMYVAGNIIMCRLIDFSGQVKSSSL